MVNSKNCITFAASNKNNNTKTKNLKDMKTNKEEEERKEYEERCAKYAHLMKSTKELNEQIGLWKECAPIKSKSLSIFKKNVLAMLAKDFPGVKFSIYAEPNGFEVDWTDGPTIKEVEEGTNLDLFCKSFWHSDPYADYGYFKTKKYCDFATNYGSYKFGWSEEINLCRVISKECQSCALDFISDIAGKKVDFFDRATREEIAQIMTAASEIDPNITKSKKYSYIHTCVNTFGQLAQYLIECTSFYRR